MLLIACSFLSYFTSKNWQKAAKKKKIGQALHHLARYRDPDRDKICVHDKHMIAG